jgi:FtsP/CotA-like multicopper oxidase with cupredoxin domain
MRGSTNRKTRSWLAWLLAAVGLALIPAGQASAVDVTIDLCAKAGSISLPGPTVVPIWGFALKPSGVACDDGSVVASLPGPQLEVNAGDTVTINVTNALPGAAPAHVLSLEAPGIAFNPGPTDADIGATVTRTFTASAPGTFLYESAGDAGRQTAMGLYGALLVRSATPNQAYNDATTAFDVEKVLVLSAIDPAFNAAPDTFDLNDYLATYWLINGQARPDTPPITATAGQRLLLRYVNAGFDNTSMMLLGMHERVVARDAYLLKNAFDADTETIPAGGTEDAIATIPSTAPPSANGFPLFNRNLHVTNGTSSGPSDSPGGMLIFIEP